MKYTLKIIASLCLTAFAVLTTSVHAAETSTDALLYISPNYYKHSVHLLHPYYTYWFEQGPLVEPIALQALQAKGLALKICTGNETADTIISIKPSVFYNSQMRMYHGKMEATLYSGSGKMLGRYVGEAQQLGYTSVDHAITYLLNKVYTAAMQNLMTKLKIDPVLLTRI
ncbi:hypothetical protein GALL_331140 [mine drainage metagenome]|uniref:Uncharacterized protein n=1 Tax=mine drainage metagenome TaxID=410659 RepID=A0A1J5QNT3_9ZZZZ